MSVLPPEKPYSQAGPIAAQMHLIGKASSNARSALVMEGGQEDGQIQLFNLQQWICELLIKNQQLRLKLAREKQDDRSSEATIQVEKEVSHRERPPVSGFLET